MPEIRWIDGPRGDSRLALHQFGGSGEGMLFLHGLAGYGREWSSVASSITSSYEVVALDLRGHGQSERRPVDLSPEAFCSDAISTIDTMATRPVHLVGQSFGGHTAFLTAAWYPERVSSLVVVEADPEPSDSQVRQRLASWLRSWPRPFPDREAAHNFFASTSTNAAVWVDGLEHREDGFWPRFDIDIVLGALSSLGTRGWWDEWKKIQCPTLIVRGDRGSLSAAMAEQMAGFLRQGELLTVANAGHDVHIDQSKRVAEVLTARVR